MSRPLLRGFFPEVRPIDAWPGQPVEPYEGRPYSPFSSSWDSTARLVERELHHLGAENVVLLLPVREDEITVDGTRLKAGAKPEHPGVVLAFDSIHGPLKYACAKYDARRGGDGWRENLRAIGLGLEALRRVERYGIASRGEQYTGWKALPPGTAMLGSDHEYVNVEDAARTLMHLADNDPDSWEDAVELVDVYYRDAAKLHHPDGGGDPDLFAKATSARDYIEAHA